MGAVAGALGLVAVGVIVLVVGGELLVRGASRLAHSLRVSPLVVGLTVVAFGTSAPELAVSLKSVLDGRADLAVGNAVGSNIFNSLFILGVSALIVPLTVSRQLIRFDVPLMILTAVVAFLLSWDGKLSRGDGAILLGLLLAYVAWSVRQSRREHQAAEDEVARELRLSTATSRHLFSNGVLVVVGLALLALGSSWLVSGATTIAKLLGVSELVIGLTIVSIGTSLPEVVASIIASLRGERDIAVGNVVGSNIFNMLAVLGVPALVTQQGVAVSPAVLNVDFPIMIAVVIAALPIFFTGHRISRPEGVLFLAYYVAYTTNLVLQATGHGFSGMLSHLLLVYAIPLTAVGLGWRVYQSLRAPRVAM